MAHIECNFYSSALKKNTRCIAFIPLTSPDDYFNDVSKNYFENDTVFQTLYLLHGSYGYGDDYPLFSNIERYAQEKCLAVIMPSVENSAYIDLPGSSAFATYCGKELPEFLRTIFPLSKARKDTFVAGLSMGGYGALYLSFKNPHQYSCCAVMSGLADFSAINRMDMNYSKKMPENYKRLLFERGLKENQFNLYRMLEQYKDTIADLPHFYFTGGQDDPICKAIPDFAQKLSEKGCSVKNCTPQGKHDWNYWETHIQDVLNWLPIEGRCVYRQ